MKTQLKFEKLTARLIELLPRARDTVQMRRDRLAQPDLGYAVRCYADNIMEDHEILVLLERIAHVHCNLCVRVEIDDEMNWSAAGDLLQRHITSELLSVIFRGVTSSSVMYMMEEIAKVSAAKKVLSYFVGYAEGLFGEEELKDIFAGQKLREEARAVEQSKRVHSITYRKVNGRYYIRALNNRDELIYGRLTDITSKPLAKAEAERHAKQVKINQSANSYGYSNTISVYEEK